MAGILGSRRRMIGEYCKEWIEMMGEEGLHDEQAVSSSRGEKGLEPNRHPHQASPSGNHVRKCLPVKVRKKGGEYLFLTA